MRRPLRRHGAALAVAALLVGSCTTGSDGGDEAAVYGGADRLPGPVAEDAAFADAPEDAPPAPVIDLELYDGTTVTGEELWDDRPVVLHFLASWCERCQEQQAELNAIAREYADRVTFLGVVGSDEVEDTQRYLRERDVPYAAGLDDDLSNWLRYGVTEPPLLAFVTRGGAIVRGFPGGTDAERVRQIIEEELLAD